MLDDVMELDLLIILTDLCMSLLYTYTRKFHLSYKKQTHKMEKICLIKINIKLNDYK